jgi:hypothetical protein
MSKGGKKDRRKEDKRRAKEAWEAAWQQIALAYSRPAGLARSQLFAILKSLLKLSNIVTKDDLIEQHRRVNGVQFLVAQAEVEEFKPRFAEDLRRDGMPLVHPLTETGIAYAATVDLNDATLIARCVPGVGGAGPTAAWRIADRQPSDPVLQAYINFRGRSGQRAYELAHRMATEAVAAGVAVSVAPLPKQFNNPLLGPGKKP